MKNNIKHGLLFLGASIICAILFLYLWNTQILDDIISDKGPLTLEGSPNAIRMGFCHLLINEPFKKYIQEHLDEFKVEESEALPVPGPTKESKDIPVILNKRLLI